MRQKTKKLLSVVLSLSMAFSVMPLTAYAADESASGGESGAPVLSLTSEANSTTTSGAAFDVDVTTGAGVEIIFAPPTSAPGTTNSAFGLDYDNPAYNYTELLEAAKEGGVTVTVPTGMVPEGNDMTVDAILAELTFSADDVAAMHEENVTLSISGFEGDAVEGTFDYVTNSAYALDLSLETSSGTPISTFANVDVAIPITDIITDFADMLDVGNGEVAVYYQDGNRFDDMNGSYADEKVTFSTTHFSTYVVRIGQDATAPESITVEVENSIDGAVTVDAQAGGFTYEIANPEIATVSGNAQNGSFTVTGVSKGTTTLTITAIGQNGYDNATAKVTIIVDDPASNLPAIAFTEEGNKGEVEVGKTFDIADRIDEFTKEFFSDLTYTLETGRNEVTLNGSVATGVSVTPEDDPVEITIGGTTVEGTTSATFYLTVISASTTGGNNGEDDSDVSYGGSSGGGGGGSSSSGYSVNVSSASNGTVSVDKDRASSGSTVTITAEPDEGYVVGSVTVTDSDGNEITVRDRGNNEYTFTMPSSRVTIEVEFVEDTTVEEPVDEITEADFSDVSSSDWFYDAVNYVFSKGIMVGVTENSFAPNSSLTRAMIVQMLYSLEGSPEVTGTAPFTDVAIGQWYTNAITWAASNNIVSGMGDGTFAPNNNITREQLAMILYNYAQLKGNAVTASGNLAAFTDGNEVSDWAETAVRWAVGEGLMSGRGNGVLDPTETTTRAEAASMFMRFMESDLA